MDHKYEKVLSEYRRAKREMKISKIKMYADSGFTLNATSEILQINPVQLRTFCYNNEIQFRKAHNGKKTTIRK
tara:strand:+ start:1292 stop:1510 length:219 start_codon:yes stop_codon:yes gene_type:complete